MCVDTHEAAAPLPDLCYPRNMVGTLVCSVLPLVLAANPYLDQGRKLYRQLFYQEAEVQLRRAIEVPTSTQEERREAYDLLARALYARGQAGDAELAYAELLGRDPHTPPPQKASPAIRELFQRAKLRVYPRGYVRLTQTPSPPGTIEVSVVDPWSEVGTLVLCEARGQEAFTERGVVLESHLGKASAPQPGPGETFRFYIEARSRTGVTVAALGSEKEPRTISGPPVPEPEPKPALFSRNSTPPGVEAVEAPSPRWAAWTLAGASLAAAAAGGILLAASESDFRAAQRAEFASDARSLQDSYRQKGTAGRVLVGAGVVGGGATALLFWRWK